MTTCVALWFAFRMLCQFILLWNTTTFTNQCMNSILSYCEHEMGRPTMFIPDDFSLSNDLLCIKTCKGRAKVRRANGIIPYTNYVYTMYYINPAPICTIFGIIEILVL